VASRTAGLPFGPDMHNPESAGALDVVSCALEFGLVVGCPVLPWRRSLTDRPVVRRGAFASGRPCRGSRRGDHGDHRCARRAAASRGGCPSTADDEGKENTYSSPGPRTREPANPGDL